MLNKENLLKALYIIYDNSRDLELKREIEVLKELDKIKSLFKISEEDLNNYIDLQDLL